MPFFLLALIALPVIEIYVVILAADAIGFLPTLFFLLATSALGIVLVRVQGRAALNRFTSG